MHRHTHAAIAAALLLALTACGNGGTPEPTVTVTVTETPGQASKTPAAGPKNRLAFGTGFTWSNDVEGKPTTATITALSYEQPVSGLTNPEWAVIEVKYCTTSGATATVSQAPWSLGFADGTRITPEIFGGPGLPRPQYPTEGAKVKAGDCLRGKIPVVLEKGQRPDRIIYEPTGLDDPVEWTVPK
jgi:hypothetical protein